MTATERWIAEREYDADQQRTTYTREQIREMYREHVYAQLLAAEDATNGYLLNRKAQAAGVDPITLFSGPAHIAYARASDDLIMWWQDHPRLTLTEYTEQITGVRNAAADAARKNRDDQQNRRCTRGQQRAVEATSSAPSTPAPRPVTTETRSPPARSPPATCCARHGYADTPALARYPTRTSRHTEPQDAYGTCPWSSLLSAAPHKGDESDKQPYDASDLGGHRKRRAPLRAVA
jgi:hypothetical protein